MLEKKTIVDQIEIGRDGSVGVRLGLLVLDEGVEVLCNYHRVTIPPGMDVDAVLAAVNADITTRDGLKARPIDDEGVARIKSTCRFAHTSAADL